MDVCDLGRIVRVVDAAHVPGDEEGPAVATQERGKRGEVRLSSVVCICIVRASIKALYPSQSSEFALFIQVRDIVEATKMELTVLRDTQGPL
jgi:hypothetical protein